MDWGNRVAEKEGFEPAMSGMTITEARKKRIYFSEPTITVWS